MIKVLRFTQLELQHRKDYEFKVGLGKRLQPKHFIFMHEAANVNLEGVRELGLLPIYYIGEKENHSRLQRLLSYVRQKTTGIIYPEPTILRNMFEDEFHG